ncbi:unnamed protein product [Adineta steineri]|uniref:Uncharacterized protein n=1 Tax=Adineta steineri TaxID=433720 RepID=A0A815PRJ0_9BILA|nr:unnamed protein product [Adineta steineri]CAF1454381.1 unnamed protein product [Adineta steineri]CAF3484751.1 unnamed protein product [Adineta steineri]CAF3684852.1 unnamed protein product [Adineta steineri]
MSSTSNEHSEVSDGKIATESAPAGMNSITNTVGMHRSDDALATPPETNVRRGSTCDKPGCTAEHSGKPHDMH